MKKFSYKWIYKVLLLVIILAGLFFLNQYFQLGDLLKNTLKKSLVWIDQIGIWGVFAFGATYILTTVLFIPGSILTLGAGAVFGVIKGTIIVSFSSILGATFAFLIGRYFLRGWVNKKISDKPNFKKVDQAVAREGWKIVGLTRLSPLFPFNFLNYAYGLTQISLKDYFFASWIGMLPGTLMYVYIGSLIGDIAALGTGVRTKTIGEWALYIVGLIATIVVTLYITKIAKNALKNQIEDNEVNDQ